MVCGQQDPDIWLERLQQDQRECGRNPSSCIFKRLTPFNKELISWDLGQVLMICNSFKRPNHASFGEVFNFTIVQECFKFIYCNPRIQIARTQTTQLSDFATDKFLSSFSHRKGSLSFPFKERRNIDNSYCLMLMDRIAVIVAWQLEEIWQGV